MTRIAWLVGGAMVMAQLVGCGIDDGSDVRTSEEVAPTWDEFLASTYKEPGEGPYIVDGDTPVADVAALHDFYDALFPADGLIVNRVGSRDDKWSSSSKNNLTYCVSKSSFGSRYNTVVSAMASATGAWAAVSNVDFVHVTSLDTSCNAQSGVVFDVRQVSNQPYLARSFFPSTGRSQRNVLIDATSFGSISPYTLTGILRHELGHTIGFRHEHTRPEARTCFEDNSWRALTTYDAKSVMHYPQCNGTNRGDLVLTSKDKSGAAALYP